MNKLKSPLNSSTAINVAHELELRTAQHEDKQLQAAAALRTSKEAQCQAEQMQVGQVVNNITKYRKYFDIIFRC